MFVFVVFCCQECRYEFFWFKCCFGFSCDSCLYTMIGQNRLDSHKCAFKSLSTIFFSRAFSMALFYCFGFYHLHFSIFFLINLWCFYEQTCAECSSCMSLFYLKDHHLLFVIWYNTQYCSSQRSTGNLLFF